MIALHRISFAALAFALCACSPPAAKEAAPVAEAPAAAPVAAAPEVAQDTSADLAGPIAHGSWGFEEGNVASSAGFGEPDSESIVFIQCERGPRRVSIGREYELSPVQDTTLTIVTAAGRYDFPARSFVEGLPTVTAELIAPDPRLSALAASKSRFAIIVRDDKIILPAHESIARVLALCGVK